MALKTAEEYVERLRKMASNTNLSSSAECSGSNIILALGSVKTVSRDNAELAARFSVIAGEFWPGIAEVLQVERLVPVAQGSP